MGFTLKEISELIFLATDEKAVCADVRSIARIKLMDIQDKIERLSRLREALGELISSCKEDGPRHRCPILESLIGGDE